mgnify:CR=1 FL=1|tara:strand:+ start:138 stop:482 length:345 start_codon:yes stop_codon:yes gene_type:complete
MKSIVEKPWGSYSIIEKGPKYLVKKIIVNPGGKLSLQSHKFRSEHWVIAEGEAEVIVNDEAKFCKENDYIFIQKLHKHRLINKSSKMLIVIEVWHGDNLDENDIERFEDIYGRT